MTIDDLLARSGLNSTEAEWYLGDIADNLSKVYFKEREKKFYSVTTDDAEDTVKYTRVMFQHHPPRIINGVAVKSPDPDIVISDSTTPSAIDPCEVDDFGFAYHGNRIVIQNDGETTKMVCIETKKGLSYLYDEMKMELKSLLFSLMAGDPSGIFEQIQRISAAKKNIRSENKMSRPAIKHRTYTPTPFEL